MGVDGEARRGRLRTRIRERFLKNLLFSGLSGASPRRNANIRLAAPDAGTNFVSRPARAASSASARSPSCSLSAILTTPSPAVAARARCCGGRRIAEQRELPNDLRLGEAVRLDRGAVGVGK